MKLYDYKCPAGHVEEHLAKDHVREQHLCSCGLIGARQLSAPAIALEGHSGSFPTAASKWEQHREKAGRGSHYQDE